MVWTKNLVTRWFGDFDGDGNEDLAIQFDTLAVPSDLPSPPSLGKVWFGKAGAAHLLNRVQEGQGRIIKVEYKGGSAVYTPCMSECGHETVSLKNPGLLVSGHQEILRTLNNGQTEQRRFQYKYTDARAGRGGRGSFGFGSRTIDEYRGGALRQQTTVYMHNTSFQRAGSVWYQVTITPLSETDTTYIGDRIESVGLNWKESTGGAPFHPTLEDRTTSVFERVLTDGWQLPQLLTSTLEEFDFDAFGNLTNHDVTTRNSDSGPPISEEISTIS